MSKLNRDHIMNFMWAVAGGYETKCLDGENILVENPGYNREPNQYIKINIFELEEYFYGK